MLLTPRSGEAELHGIAMHRGESRDATFAATTGFVMLVDPDLQLAET